MTIKEAKQHLRAFMRAHYTDERLAALLAHARDGKLVFGSCCCFIGSATADHALKGAEHYCWREPHLALARTLCGAYHAEQAYKYIARGDIRRRRIIIPMIRAEMKRRERERQARCQLCDEPRLVADWPYCEAHDHVLGD